LLSFLNKITKKILSSSRTGPASTKFIPSKIEGLRASSTRSGFAEISSRSDGGGAEAGQVALLLIVMVAILFIFYAVVLNLGRISQTKTQVTMASNISAAFLASGMASYAESVYQGQLGGPEGNPDPNAGDDLTVCGWTGVAAAVLALIILVIATVISITSGGTLTFAAFATAKGIIFLILSVGSILLQALVLQPGMNSLWNKQMAQLETPADQFVERGIQMALQYSVDDTSELLDTKDIDMDGILNEEVNRFGYFYTQRMNAKFANRRILNRDILQDFQRALGAFLLEPYIYYEQPPTVPPNPPPEPVRVVHTDLFAVADPTLIYCSETTAPVPPQHASACCGANPPAECNRCCVPPNVRPCCCDGGSDCPDPATPSCGSSANCSGIYPNIAGGYSTGGYPYVFNALHEDPNIGFLSFRKFLGHDDETPYYRTNPLNPNGPQILDRTTHPFRFRRDDLKGAFFPTLWDAAARASLDFSAIYDEFEHYVDFCYWATPQYVWNNTYAYCNNNDFPYAAVGHLELPYACDNASPLTCFVPSTFDNVPNASGIRKPVVPPDGNEVLKCPGESTYPPGWWKRGDVQYCTKDDDNWPYSTPCPGKECDRTCTSCTESAGICSIYSNECESIPGTWPERYYKVLWSEDEADLLRRSLTDFTSWSLGILAQGSDELARSFLSWYPEFLSWVGPGGVLDDYGSSGSVFNEWSNTLSDWANRSYHGNSSYECNPNYNPARTISQIADCHRNTRAPAHDTTANQYADCYAHCNYSYPACYSLRNPCNLSGSCQAAELACVQEYWHGEANEAAMHRFRADFLDRTINNVTSVIATLNRYRDAFHTFVNSPAVTGVTTEYNRVNVNPEDDADLAPYAIYAWRSDPPETPRPGQFAGKGYWHIVQVEARLPTRCNGKCARASQGYTHEPSWPWIKTYTKNWGTRKCYTLGDSFDQYSDGAPNSACDEPGEYHEGSNARVCFRGGAVKSRVIRYDEDKDALLTFANKVPIWRFIAHHADRDSITPERITQLEAACDPGNQGAFMINDVADPPEITACYNIVRHFLYRGVMSKTCAEYFFHQEDPYGFNVKFSRCSDEF